MPLDVRLDDTAVSEEVTVTASLLPERISESPASVVEVRAEDFAAYPGAPPDVALREVPGFALFRRSDSRLANPTAQGVSLRGIGGSGASRAAVLDDGVPLNDAFGGWVAWGRVPSASLDRAEVVRGGASSLYGGSALAGAIQLIRRVPDRSAVDAEASYGSFGTADVSAFAGGSLGPWRARISGEGFRTDGAVAVAPENAGAVDTPLSGRHGSGELRVERELENGTLLFASGSIYRDRRENGTPLQDNETQLEEARAGAEAPVAGGTASGRVYATWEDYSQSFSAIAADRESERRTSLQSVPSRAVGGTGQWSGTFGAHAVAAGVEGRDVLGESDETLFPFGGGTAYAAAGGRQLTGAVFVEDRIAAGARTTVVLGGRFDSWRNFDAFRSAGPDPGSAERHDLASRTETFFSPRLALAWRAGSDATLVASAYRSFRAPTLNELYRGFRVGNVVTLPNADLSAERLTGGEVGAVWTPAAGRVLARATLYWMEVSDPVTSVTLSASPDLITRAAGEPGQNAHARRRARRRDADRRGRDARRRLRVRGRRRARGRGSVPRRSRGPAGPAPAGDSASPRRPRSVFARRHRALRLAAVRGRPESASPRGVRDDGSHGERSARQRARGVRGVRERLRRALRGREDAGDDRGAGPDGPRRHEGQAGPLRERNILATANMFDRSLPASKRKTPRRAGAFRREWKTVQDLCDRDPFSEELEDVPEPPAEPVPVAPPAPPVDEPVPGADPDAPDSADEPDAPCVCEPVPPCDPVEPP